jgi:pyruvate, water dikinase
MTPLSILTLFFKKFKKKCKILTIMELYIKPFKQLLLKDVPLVGGKNASLGEMFNRLAKQGVPVPDGFATTSAAFWYVMDYNDLRPLIKAQLAKLDRVEYANLNDIGLQIRTLILNAAFPEDLAKEIIKQYKILGNNKDLAVAVRSSATAEDLPNASFAGQHESYLNIKGEKAVLKAVQDCMASLFTARAIKYREDNGFDHSKIALSVGVQKMVRSDLACSGIGFTLEPESGFKDIIHLSGVWGLGENIVQGAVTPDEFFVFKPALAQNRKAIIQKRLGEKALTMVYSTNKKTATINKNTPSVKREQFVLTDEEVLKIARWALIIEEHYGKSMDIEWAKDGETNELFILQARPETVHSQRKATIFKEYKLLERGKVLVEGDAIGSKIVSGIARVFASPEEANRLKKGEIIVTDMTSPDWDPILKKCSAIVTNKGGRTSHAAIVARELGVAAIVGAEGATKKIKDGDLITVSCGESKTGFVYAGALKFEEKSVDFSDFKMPEQTHPMLIIADPDQAFKWSFYPNNGVGLMRMELIITHFIQIHPMALVKFDELKTPSVKKQIEALTHHYADKKAYFIDKLSQGIATIAGAFYPKDVIVRMSDFKTNEYANLIGGKDFEPIEENPMLGFRGASRYYNDLYKEGFELECQAIKVVREEMGLTNVKVMIPFCRTVDEGKKVVEVMRQYGLKQKANGLEIYMMVEIPSNVLLADEFAKIFDGFSIGSNDLTQLTLGIDRDSAIVSDLFNENNEAVKQLLSTVIKKAKQAGIKIGLCGQAPSDFPEFAQFLVEQGIDSISFNADALLRGIENINKAELNRAVPI